MESSIVWMLILQAALIGLNAVFACAEIAIISMNDNKMEKMASEGDKRAIRLEKLTSQPARFLATIQVAITLSGFLGSAFAAENFSDPIVKFIMQQGWSIPEKTVDTIVVILITIVLSYFTLIFGELVPKRIAMRKAESLALGLSGMISGISTIFAPLVGLLTVSTNVVLRLLGIDPNEEDSEVSEEEIRMMVDAGSEKGTIDNHEKEFIQNVFEFDDITAGEIVTHRKELTLLFLEDSEEEWEEIIGNSFYNLYPVCDESADNVVGILHAKEYLRLKDKSRANTMKEAVKEPYFVPENITADVLFKNMKNEHQKMAIVLDEYGGLCGIVTLTDLIEELLGDLGDDENQEEHEEEFIEQIDERTWKVGGRTTLESISETIGISLEDEDHDTLNGFVFHALGAVPQDGTTMKVEHEQVTIEVTDIKEHQIHMAILHVKEREPEED